VEVLGWLAIPVGAVLLALVWVAWVSRSRPPADVQDTLEDYQRFKAAFERHAKTNSAESLRGLGANERGLGANEPGLGANEPGTGANGNPDGADRDPREH
jgi:hypothetical protein